MLTESALWSCMFMDMVKAGVCTLLRPERKKQDRTAAAPADTDRRVLVQECFHALIFVFWWAVLDLSRARCGIFVRDTLRACASAIELVGATPPGSIVTCAVTRPFHLKGSAMPLCDAEGTGLTLSWRSCS